MKKTLSFALVSAMLLSTLAACSSSTETATTDTASTTTTTTTTESASTTTDTASSGDVIQIEFPTMWVGVNSGTEWREERVAAFNAQYAGQYEVIVEEIAGDQAYVDKMKVQYSADSLPDVIYTGGYNLIDLMSDKFVNIYDYADADWLATMSEEGIEANSQGDALYGVPFNKQVIGYFYNKDLFAEAGIEAPAETWEEFFAQCDKLQAIGVTPVSMDTADSGWVTSLMLGAMIAGNDAGEEFMNTKYPTDYNTTEFIEAATMIQELFMNYTTANAVGGAYENAAMNFFMENTAIIANGPWMVGDFYDTSMVEEGFADKIGVAAYPGNVMYNSGKIGFNIAADTPETIEAALAFVEFMTSEESQRLQLEVTGETPDNADVVSDNVMPLVTEVNALGAEADRSINDFQSLWYPNVVEEISVQYPLLAQGSITPEEFAAALSATAQSN